MKNLNFGPYHDWDRTVPPLLTSNLAGAAPQKGEVPYTVTCLTPDCPNRDAGPWRILGGFDSETYHCSRCGRLMTLTAGWGKS